MHDVCNALSKFTHLSWVVFKAVLGCTLPVGCRLDKLDLDDPPHMLASQFLDFSSSKDLSFFYLSPHSHGHTLHLITRHFLSIIPALNILLSNNHI